MKKPNERHAKAELAKARNRKAKRAQQTEDKHVSVLEDVDKMTARLLNESRTSLRREIFRKSCNRVADEFLSDVKSRKEAMEEEEREEVKCLADGQRSETFRSQELISYSDVEGEGGDEKANDRKADRFEKNIEKKFAKQLGIIGYG